MCAGSLPAGRPREGGTHNPWQTSDAMGLPHRADRCVQAERIRRMGPLSSQTKCNTSRRGCCDGTAVRPAFTGSTMRDCPTSSRRVLDPADRCSSGSLAIDDLSRDKAQSGQADRLQAELRGSTDPSTALEGRTPTTGALPAPCGDRPAEVRLVARTDRRPAGARGRPQGDLLREHLPLHLRPDGSHQGLPLAALSAARQEQAWLSRKEGRKLGNPHRRPCFLG